MESASVFFRNARRSTDESKRNAMEKNRVCVNVVVHRDDIIRDATCLRYHSYGSSRNAGRKSVIDSVPAHWMNFNLESRIRRDSADSKRGLVFARRSLNRRSNRNAETRERGRLSWKRRIIALHHGNLIRTESMRNCVLLIIR